MHESTTHGPPLEKTARLIVELLGNLLTNFTPVLRLSFDWLGINDLLDHRQVVRQPRRLGLSGAWRAWRLAGCNGRRLCRGWGLGQQQQLQLRRIEFFTAGTKHAAHEQVHLLAQQLIFAQSRRQSLLGLCQLLGQFGYTRCHSLRDPILCRAKCSKIFEKSFGAWFHGSRSYHGRNLAPRKSTPSVNIAKASARRQSLVVPGSIVLGQEKVPFSNRLVSTHKPVPSQYKILILLCRRLQNT